MKSFIIFILTIFLTFHISIAKTNKWKRVFHAKDDLDSIIYKGFKPYIQNSEYTGDSLTCSFFGRAGSNFNSMGLRSEDGGNSWKLALATPMTKLYSNYHQTSFVASSNFIVLSFDPDTILRTTNGGKIWDTIITNLNGNLLNIDFQKNGLGFGVIYSHISESQQLIQSFDYGSEWKLIANQPKASDFNDSQNLTNQIYYSNPSIQSDSIYTVIVTTVDTYYQLQSCIKTYYLCRSENAGKTWSIKKIFSGPGFQGLKGSFVFENMFFINKLEGWISVDTIPALSQLIQLWKTSDGGNTWMRKYYNLPDYPFQNSYGMSFYDTLQGVVFGHNGYMLRTYDGGETWSVDSSILDVDDINNNITLQGRYLTSKKMIFINFGGSIYLYNEDGFPESDVNVTTDNSYFINISPNPIYDNLKININFEFPDYLRIDLLNALGQSVMVPINEFSEVGQYEKELDLKRLSSGLYFVIINKGRKQYVQKFIKI